MGARTTARLVVGLAALFSVLSTGCSEDCGDAQDECEGCGVDAATCASQLEQCSALPEQGGYTREDCCLEILESYDPCP